MVEDKNSYRDITKSIGLFGGVKIFQIIINLIKNKVLAVLLGPYGMGVSGMIISTASMVASLTNFGLQTSSVRDVSKAYKKGNQVELSEIVTVLQKLVWFTGLLGSAIAFLFAKYFCVWAFGNDGFTIYFRMVSVILFLDQLCVGQTVLLQGTFHYKYMAKASLYGSIVGLIATVPLYYILGLNGVVPVIVLSSVINLAFTTYYSRKVPFKKVALSLKLVLTKGNAMIKMGIALALSGLVGTASIYIQRLLLSNIGSIEDVGLYTAGIGIATQYINIIFASIGSDYSPRLAAISNDNDEFIRTINRQMKMLVTIISPLILLFIVFIREITILLYSDRFLAISGMLEWVMFGMFFRATSWSISYALIARGDAKPFFVNELITNIFSFFFSIVGYYLYSFEGMGIGFCLTYVLYTIQLYYVGYKSFKLIIGKEVIHTIAKQILVVLIISLFLKMLGYIVWRYVVGIVGMIIICCITYGYLDEMIGLDSIINRVKSKFKK